MSINLPQPATFLEDFGRRHRKFPWFLEHFHIKLPNGTSSRSVRNQARRSSWFGSLGFALVSEPTRTLMLDF